MRDFSCRAFAKAATIVVAVGALALSFGVTTASADSIVFAKADNVWLANPDGTGQYQVTTDGTSESPYSSPTQADDGTIVALKGSLFSSRAHRMKQNGELLVPPFVPGGTAGARRPEVSPDGQLLAYYVLGTATATSSSFVASATGPSNRTAPGGFSHPSWAGNSRLLLSFNAQNTHLSSAPFDGTDGVYFDGDTSVYDAEISAAGGKIAWIGGRDSGDGLTLQFAQQTGPPPAAVTNNPCGIAQPLGDVFAQPSWSPNGDKLVWEEGDGQAVAGAGIWRADVGTLPGAAATDEECVAAISNIASIVPGGSEPDYGPAPVNPGPRPTATPDPTATPTPTVTPAPGDVPRTTGDAAVPVISALKVAPRRVRGSKGAAISFAISQAGSVRFTVEASRPGRRVGRTCRTPSRSNRSRPGCSRFVALVGGFSASVAAGSRVVRFTGRIAGRRLARGSYRLVARATDAGGRRSLVVRAPFQVIR